MAHQIKVKGNYTKAQTQKDKDFVFNKMLKKWKNKYAEFGIREEIVDRREFIKPSLKKRREKEQAIRLNQQEVQRIKEENGGK